MKNRLCSGMIIFMIILMSIPAGGFFNVRAQSLDAWWDEAWPYRVAVHVSDPVPTGINLNFSQLFSDLGLVDAILDLRSVRVIPVVDGAPGEPVPFQETYSTPFIDAEILNTDASSTEPFWSFEDAVDLTSDGARFTEGVHSLQAAVEILANHGAQPDFIYNFNGNPISDWSQYETLTYDLWPEVNESALDQSPDLYQFELVGLEGCNSDNINSPALALDQWNNVSVSLSPFGDCATPDVSSLTGLRFYFLMGLFGNSTNDYEAGDQVTLWLDNFRLVNQDGEGEIQWIAEPGIETYYIYFDTLNHTGHDSPDLVDIPPVETQATISGPVETGGYFHQITGADTAGLTLWTAPITEKILKEQSAPLVQNSLEITAAKGEYEALQLIAQSPINQDLQVSVSDLIQGPEIIPASEVQIFRVDYVELTRLSDEYGRLTAWPDPLYPLLPGEEVTFLSGENQPLWFRIKVPELTPAGQYFGEIFIGNAVIPFTLTVLDFTLSEQFILPFAAGLDLDTLLEAYGGTVQGEIQPCYNTLNDAINQTLETYYITPLPIDTEPSPGLVYSLTTYPQVEAQTAQLQSGESVWWSFTAYDLPPFPNPSIIDRPGLDAIILPWMAWADRVDGIYYHQLNDWDTNPWESPYTNDLANGDGTLFYPPKDDSVGFDPCNPVSNRLIPSIRLELLREGLEDYAYLRLLNGKPGDIKEADPSDTLVARVLSSRTLYRRSPTEIAAVRAEAASLIIASQTKTFIPMLNR